MDSHMIHDALSHSDIMHVVSRELDRYSGHLRQFIVDDKGMRIVRERCYESTFPYSQFL
jgi:hypothetical protein